MRKIFRNTGTQVHRSTVNTALLCSIGLLALATQHTAAQPSQLKWQLEARLHENNSFSSVLDLTYSNEQGNALRILAPFHELHKTAAGLSLNSAAANHNQTLSLSAQEVIDSTVHIRLGHLALSGLAALFQNPVSASPSSLDSLPLVLSQSASTQAGFLLSTQFFSVYAVNFAESEQNILGLELSLPFAFTTFSRLGSEAIPATHRLIRLALQYEVWRGSASSSLIASNWLAAPLRLVNTALIINIPLHSLSHSLVDVYASEPQTKLEGIVGVQTVLPQKIVHENWYTSHDPVFWARLHFDAAGQLSIVQPEHSTTSLQWKFGAQFMHLSKQMLRVTSGSAVDPRTQLIVHGSLTFVDSLNISGELEIRDPNEFEGELKLALDTQHIELGTQLNAQAQSNEVDLEFFFKTKGFFQLDTAFHMQSNEVGLNFDSFSLNVDIGSEKLTGAAELSISHIENTPTAVDFFPSPFDTNIGLAFELKINSPILHIQNSQDNIEEIQSKISIRTESPDNFPLSSLVYEEDFGTFFRNWRFSFSFELQN